MPWAHWALARRQTTLMKKKRRRVVVSKTFAAGWCAAGFARERQRSPVLKRGAKRRTTANKWFGMKRMASSIRIPSFTSFFCWPRSTTWWVWPIGQVPRRPPLKTLARACLLSTLRLSRHWPASLYLAARWWLAASVRRRAPQIRMSPLPMSENILFFKQDVFFI